MIPSDAILGNHIIRFIANWNDEVGEACSSTSYGETEDYSVNIIQSLSLTNNNSFDFNIYPNPANSNFITIKSIFQGIKIVDIFDVNGRKLLSTSIYTVSYTHLTLPTKA